MNDTHIQDVADIDQPAELEGIQLNWGPSEFVETPSSSHELRTAPATPEFWEVWHRNKEALQIAGISYSDDQSPGNWRVEWRLDVSNDICISEGEFYTLSEVVDFVKQALDNVSEQSAHNPLRYSSTDVYWLLHDMIRYINHNVPGEFLFYQTQKGVYRVRYTTDDSAKRSSSHKLKAEVNRTAKYLEELTGKRPAWGEKEE